MEVVNGNAGRVLNVFWREECWELAERGEGALEGAGALVVDCCVEKLEIGGDSEMVAW